MEICISVVAKIAEYAVELSCQQCNYVICYNGEVDHLTEQVERLGDIRDSVRREVDAAKRNLQPIAPQVERWLRAVDETIQETEASFGNERVADTSRCLRGWCPNLKSRYSLGKKAKKMTVKVDKLLEEGTFQKVADPRLPPGLSSPSAWAAESECPIEDAKSNPVLPSNMIFHSAQAGSELEMGSTSSAICPPLPMEPSEGFEYKLPFTKQVLEALQDDRVKIIGISGIVGGEEAVTLKEFKQRVDHLFEDVATAVVSPHPNLERIQGEIANLLGLDMENKDLEERAKLLSDRMAKASERFLIILVDIWDTFNLEAVGISHVGVGNSCKIILMSPKINVFSVMRYQSSFKLISVSTSNIGGAILDFESRNSIFRQVMDYLKDDGINPILICGLGGIGKTTMVRRIHNKAKEQGLFDEIVIVDVTRNANTNNIQDQIADYLGLDLSDSLGVTARADRLYERLSPSKRVLVILDNVWTKLDLEKVGIPSPRRQRGCKILVTSQKQDVFNEIKTKKIIKIDVLPESEAWSMFKEAAGSSIESPHLRPIAEQVLSECGGLPIAILTVGRALQNKGKELWSNARDELRKANPDHIEGMKKDVYQSIKLSYNLLESKEAKSCFLLCCLYPESSNIAIEDILRHSFGLELFEDNRNMSEGRNSVLASIDILKTCFLLLDSNKEGCVKMHDVVRDAGLSIAARQGLKVGKRGFEYEYTSTVLMKGAQAGLLLVSGLNTTELPMTIFDETEKHIKVLDLTNLKWSISPSPSQMKHLQTLCLEHCKISNISMIGQIQTLMILSLRGSRIGRSFSELPIEIKIGDSSRIRRRDLSRMGRSGLLSELPSEIGNLSNLRSLDLTGCRLYGIGLDVISRLVNLEELYMRGNWKNALCNQRFMLEEEEEEEEELHMRRQRLMLEEEKEKYFMSEEVKAEKEYSSCFSKLVFFENLTTLETVLPRSPEFLQHTKFFEKLDRFYLAHSIDRKDWCSDDYCTGNLLELKFRDRVVVVADSAVNQLLKKARIVLIENVRFGDLEDERWFVNVKSLTLRNCDGLEYLSDVTLEPTPPVAFPMLESLKIHGQTSLKEICHGQLPNGSFEELRQLLLSDLSQLTHLWIAPCQFEFLRNLRRVEITKCNSLESLFLFSTINDLGQLEELDIEDCSNLKEVVAFQGLDEACYIKFPFLIRLNLKELPSLMGISNTVRRINFHVLITLKLEQLPELTSLFPKNMVLESSYDAAEQYLFDSKVDICPQLKFLVVERCDNLSIVFSSELVQKVQNLEQLEVRQCSKLIKLFETEGLHMKETHAAAAYFSSLEKVGLTDLPMLEYLWKAPPKILAFQNLKSLQVENCRSLKNVFSFSIAQLLGKLQSIYISKCNGMEEVVATNEGHDQIDAGETNKKIVFPRVSTMHLDQLPCVRTFCPVPCTVEWPSLTTLVLCCPRMEEFVPEVLPNNIFNEKVNFPILKTLELRNMKKTKHIWSSPLLPYSFCELKYLNISDCFNLLLLLPRYMQNRLQKLKKLTVSNCSWLQNVFEPAKSMDSEPSFQNLRFITISGCNGLRNLLSTSMATGLVKLEKLSVTRCFGMIELIRKAEESESEETEGKTVLPGLTHLELDYLPKLTSFSQGKDTFEWPLMESVDISLCGKLETFFFQLVTAPSVEKVEAKKHNGDFRWRRSRVNSDSDP